MGVNTYTSVGGNSEEKFRIIIYPLLLLVLHPGELLPGEILITRESGGLAHLYIYPAYIIRNMREMNNIRWHMYLN